MDSTLQNWKIEFIDGKVLYSGVVNEYTDKVISAAKEYQALYNYRPVVKLDKEWNGKATISEAKPMLKGEGISYDDKITRVLQENPNLCGSAAKPTKEHQPFGGELFAKMMSEVPYTKNSSIQLMHLAESVNILKQNNFPLVAQYVQTALDNLK